MSLSCTPTPSLQAVERVLYEHVQVMSVCCTPVWAGAGDIYIYTSVCYTPKLPLRVADHFLYEQVQVTYTCQSVCYTPKPSLRIVERVLCEQVQMTYTRRDGMKCLRVLSKSNQATSDRKNMEEVRQGFIFYRLSGPLWGGGRGGGDSCSGTGGGVEIVLRLCKM